MRKNKNKNNISKEDINKDKVFIVILGVIFFITVMIAPKSTEVNNPRAAFYYSIKENPIMFILFVALVFALIFFINRFLDKRRKNK